MATGTIFRLMRRFRDMGKYRDSVLIGIGLVYLSGYVVWFIIAWKQGLGPVPVLDTQYFVAGLPVLLMLAVLLLILLSLRWLFFDFWPARLQKIEDRRLRLLVVIPVFAMCSALIGIVMIAEIFRGGTVVWRLIGWSLLLIFFVCWTLSLECLHEVLERRRKTHPGTLMWLAAMWSEGKYVIDASATGGFTLMLTTLCLLYYLHAIYTAIPQEFGGAKSRMARLSLVRDSVSPEMALRLSGRPVTDPNQKIVSTQRIAVLFAGSDSLIINPAPDDPNSVDRVEISRDAIKAIVWCRDKKPAGKPVAPTIKAKTQ